MVIYSDATLLGRVTVGRGISIGERELKPWLPEISMRGSNPDFGVTALSGG